MKHLVIRLLGLLFIFSFLSCNNLKSPLEERIYRAKKADNNQPIIIGAAAPWKIIKNLGFYREGLEMALEEVNEKGVLGRKVKLLFKDDNASVKQGRIVAQEFAENPDMVAVIGHYNSSVTEPVSIIYQHYGLLMMTATSTDTGITSRDGLNLIFRNIPNDREVAFQTADLCLKKKFMKMAVINMDDDFGSSLANAFENRASNIGINVVDRRTYDNTSGSVQFKKIAELWKDYYSIDAVFLAGVVPKAALFIKELRKTGLTIPVVGGDGLDSPLLWQTGGEYVEGVIVATYFHPDEPEKKAKEFTHKFYKKYGKKPDAWAAQAYDTLKVLCVGFEKAKTTIPNQVSKALKSMEPYYGATGEISFDNKGDVNNKKITAKIVKNQKFEFYGTD